MASAKLQCQTAPGLTFASLDDPKAHYHTDWHRYNLKRKVAGLPMLTQAMFERVRSSRAPPAVLPELLCIVSSSSLAGCKPDTVACKGSVRCPSEYLREGRATPRQVNDISPHFFMRALCILYSRF